MMKTPAENKIDEKTKKALLVNKTVGRIIQQSVLFISFTTETIRYALYVK